MRDQIQRDRQARDIFLRAVAIQSREARAACLEGACQGDASLRSRVEVLLANHQEDAFLESPAGDERPLAINQPTISEGPGTLIGRYTLLEKIGEGGFGVVYVAEQHEPVKRRVALKIIKPGLDTRQVVGRFEAERQALALMDHPNIAKVFDGGATDAGRPYFVMELVRGIPITQYCDQNQLSAADRLKLFKLVCQAIQHAHQKGIIHRDIKPSNVLLTVNDGVPVPKVIDFGIAKATQGELTEKTVYTQFQQFIGTPAYMSPEQADMTRLDIDTRSDIYALGVLLYELLVGQTPFDASELMASGLDAMRKTIREQEPVRPSTKLSQTLVAAEATARTTGGVEGTASSGRRLRMKETLHQLKGDLDWIVMKCLEKDRTRRYETANGLAADIQRYLTNEPITARPPSRLYGLQKLARRNKAAFASVISVASVLVLGVVVSTWQAIRATRAEREQSRQREVAVKARASEAVQRKLAEEQRNAAIEQRQLAEKQRNVAVEQRKLTDMQFALQAWEDGDFERANDLIEASRPEPGGAPAFEWRYLRKLYRDQSIKKFGDSNHEYRSALFLDRDLLLLNDNTTLTIHDLLSRQKDQLLLEDPDGIQNSSLCSGNTNLLATVTNDGRLKVWDLAARRVQVEFEGHRSSSTATFAPPYKTITFSGDGRWLASAISDACVMIWDVKEGSPRPVHTVRYEYWASAVFSSDGGHMFTCGSESMIRAWNVATGTEEGTPLEGHLGWLYALAMSPDGLHLASGGSDGRVLLWDVMSHKRQTQFLGHSGQIVALAFSPDGRTLASGGTEHTIWLWDTKTGQKVSLLRGHRTQVEWLSFSPDGRWLVSRSRDGLVKVWQTTLGLEENVLTGGGNSLMEVALSPDGKLLASVGASNFAVDLWDLSTGKRTQLDRLSKGAQCVAFSPDGKMLAAGSHDETVRLWDVGNHKAVATFTNQFPVGSLAFSPDGQTLMAGGSKNSFLLGSRGGLKFWDVPSRAAAGIVPGTASDIVAVAWSPDGSLLATGHNDGPVSLWDAQTRRLLRRFESQFGKTVLSLAFSPTEPLLAASDWGGNIVFYNTRTMEVALPQLKAHSQRILSLAFSPDGRTLASAAEGGGLQLWHVALRQVTLTLKGHVGSVKGVAFSRDGNFLASCGVDGIVRLWPAEALAESGRTVKPQGAEPLK